jgi:hypothetical protein
MVTGSSTVQAWYLSPVITNRHSIFDNAYTISRARWLSFLQHNTTPEHTLHSYTLYTIAKQLVRNTLKYFTKSIIMYGRGSPFGGGMRGQRGHGRRRRPGFGPPDMMPDHPGMMGDEHDGPGGMPSMPGTPGVGGHGGMFPGMGGYGGMHAGMMPGIGRGEFGGIGHPGMGQPGMGHLGLSQQPMCRANQLRMLQTMRMLEEMDYGSDSDEDDYPPMVGFGGPPPGMGGMRGFGGGRF